VCIAPGDQHITVKHHHGRYQIATDDGPQVNSCRPSVDVLFRSVAACYSSSSLAVVLTGMGQDGLDGSHAITGAGGRVIVQDQPSSVVWGMPGHVATAGLADVVLPPGDIGAEIVRRVGLRR
jgi:two-component system chemotaxis response regulator CheB